MDPAISVKVSAASLEYDVVLSDLAAAGAWARTCLGPTAKKLAIISNPTVFKLYGSPVEKGLRKAGFQVSHFLMGDGERYKSLRTVEKALHFLSDENLTRTDAVVALGGGVVGDLAGFVAAIHLRGVRFLQIPTTLLAMVDSSVGGKTGVNTTAGKNLVGSFHHPSGVMVDVSTLRTLKSRDLTAGLCEMVKHAAISGESLFQQIERYLSDFSVGTPDLGSELSKLILSNIRFKAAVVAGDGLESPSRTDSDSRKILNFGHTLAHALEGVTQYKYFKHGEAVGYGVLFAARLSKSLALCSQNDVDLLNDVVHRVGALPTLAGIDPKEVLKASRSDKKQGPDGLQMVLLEGIGKPLIIGERDIPVQAIRTAMNDLFAEWT